MRGAVNLLKRAENSAIKAVVNQSKPNEPHPSSSIRSATADVDFVVVVVVLLSTSVWDVYSETVTHLYKILFAQAFHASLYD